MAWTYDASLPSSRDKVRLLIGDTATTDQQLQNGEVDFFVALRGDIYLAAADAARAIAARYARQADTSNLSLSISASQRAEAYGKLAVELAERSVSLGGADMFVGGASIAEKEARSEDADAVQPSFRIGQDDHPGAHARLGKV